ncbi:MAG: competence/damage-inducible protein A [Gemmatimonadales bacterium]
MPLPPAPLDLELITIGTELLLGFTVDTNAAFIGRTLAEVGVRVARRTSVSDDPAAIAAAVSEALSRSPLVLTVGGLGPTRDDMTKRVVADLFDAPLRFDQAIWEQVVARFARLGRVPSPSNRSQAEVPEGALVLPNARGTAPGLWLSGAPGEVIMLPGVPSEMRGLMEAGVLPRLRQRTGGSGAITTRVVRTTAIPESTLAERLTAVEDGLGALTLGYAPGLEGVDLRLTSWGGDPDEAQLALTRVEAELRLAAGAHCYGTGHADLAAVLLDACRARGLSLAVAESCTGGLVGQRLTEVPGSSAVFRGGVIAYHNELKTSLLGVEDRLLQEHGAVSEPAVRAMARGAARVVGARAAVSVSGVAGPDGGSDDKPVGTVWFGFVVDDRVEASRVVFFGSRAEVRARAAQYALFGLWRQIEGP